MTNSAYQNKLDLCSDLLLTLPACELHYFLQLLINSIKSKPSKLTMKFADELSLFISNLSQLQTISNAESQNNHIEKLLINYQTLCEISKVSSWPVKIGYFLLKVGGALAALLAGMVCGLIGGFAGFGRGIINLSNPFSEGLIGVVTGYMTGAAIAFRAPSKLFKNELTRQIKFCLDGISVCINRFEENGLTEFNRLKEKKRAVVAGLFKDNPAEFDLFLNGKIPYSICTLNAQFISPSLEGFIGQHALINIPIKGQNFLLELSPSKSDLTRPAQQIDERLVDGATIINMLALHELLQQNHYCSLKYALIDMKPGDNDCLSYVNKILTGTYQDATKVRRFSKEENWISRNIVSFFVQGVSPFKQNILDNDSLDEVAVLN